MMIYRYEVPELNRGIFGAVKNIFDFNNKEELHLMTKLMDYFDNNLKVPDIDMKDTESWFTKRGNRKFKKYIKKMNTIIEIHNYSVSCIQKELHEDEILYKDKYQIIISKKSSTTSL